MTAAGARSRRVRQLSAIHAARRDLGLDEETYRGVLETITGCRSAADLAPAALDRVLDWFSAQGWKPPRKDRSPDGAERNPGRPRVSDFTADQDKLAAHRAAGAGPQEALILALWDELADAGAFRHGTAARLDTFMARQGAPVSHPRFCDPRQASRVIEGLRAWLARTRKKAEEDAK
jgi:hypothetical protein